MAQTNFTPILLYASSTPTNVPSAGNLINSSTGSEIAINIADKNLFFKDSTNAVNTVPIRQSSASSNGWLSSTDWSTFNNKTSNLGTVTSVAATVPAFLSISGSPITTSGTLAIALSGTALPVANGGTGVTTSTGSANNVLSTSPTLATPIISTTLGVGGATPSGSGSGVTFPATQSASTDVNTLDDYEEGTWTPTWSVSGGTIAAVNNEGFYTKIGRQVFVGGYIAYGNSTTGTPTGTLSIAGLPFTSSTGYGQGGGKQAGRGYAGYSFWLVTPQTTLNIAASGTTLSLSAVYTDMNRGFSNSDQVYFFATYFV